jgi:response regulator RpfG family c-di-GMP phosphodiesterase
MEDVIPFLSRLGGTQFDPALVKLFMDNVLQFTELRYALK